MHITPLFINLLWLPIAAHIKTQCINVFLQNHPLLKSITSDLCASRSLRSANERHFMVHPKETQNHFHRLLHELFPRGVHLNPAAIFKNHLTL